MASDPVRLPEILFSRTDAEAAMAKRGKSGEDSDDDAPWVL